jgi:hypothetical protein
VATLPSLDALLDEPVADAPAPTRVPGPPVAEPHAEPPTDPVPPAAPDARRHTVGGTVVSVARVSLDANNRASEVTLVGNGGRWRLPADLAPGRYQVQADFGLGTLQSAGSVDVSGAAVTVRCAMNNCAVVR